ncbi:Sphingosine N-acyltransferase-like protein FUM17 [Vanrija pseudolonga]|uniref:Sphingosine N-acyltransferase-like protein FUM17 n=1 Tax=Vanrija pseudolonga TaxID=143232 RepID=A0AAF0Y9E8_9TREE|nr:Sphingosine N-acyltransferase-like protein FUM17 [Vanrija pseudolonga]
MSTLASPQKPQKPANRRRSSSVTNALKQIPLNQHTSTMAASSSEVQPLPKGKPRPSSDGLPERYHSLGFKEDLRTGRWMLVPSSAFILMIIPILLWANQWILIDTGMMGPFTWNPFEHLLFVSYKLPNGKYVKGLYDFVFIAYYIVVWSFVRQFVTLYVLRPLAKSLGIKGAKIMRFTEQGYAIFYFGIMGTAGIAVMRQLPTWWYKTEYFFIDYPHREMPWGLKTYYLVQAAYWCQQTIILALKIEKPRKDFHELVAHHAVTLWLIGWSYGISLTYIGVSIFVSMDVSDIFLALAKCVNYVSESASTPFFAVFVGVWTYFRHYLNLWILWGVYTQFDLIPYDQRATWRPLEDMWMVWWMKWQIFAPIFLLQCINLFWYFLIWRILFRIVFLKVVKDERSDDESEEEEPQKTVAGADKAQ